MSNPKPNLSADAVEVEIMDSGLGDGVRISFSKKGEVASRISPKKKGSGARIAFQTTKKGRSLK